MANTSWESLLNYPGAGANWTGLAGTPVTNTLTEGIISPTAPDFTFNLHAPSLFVGQVIRVIANGVYSTTLTPTLNLQLKYGGTAGVVWLATGAVTTISGAANASWHLQGLINCRSVGTAGAVVAHGWTIGLAAAATIAQMPVTGAQATIAVDTTTQKALVLTATWGTANAANTVTCTQFIVEGLA